MSDWIVQLPPGAISPVHMRDPFLDSPYKHFVKHSGVIGPDDTDALEYVAKLCEEYDKLWNHPPGEMTQSFFKDKDGNLTPREVSQVAPSLSSQDWEALRKSIIENGSIRNASVMAYMPLHPPVRTLRQYSESIEPIMDPDYYRRKTGKLKGEISDNQGQEETSEPTGGTQAQEDDDVGRSPAD